MPLDAFSEAYQLSLWKGVPVREYTVALDALRDSLPSFELRPFGTAPNNNPSMRCIVRMPTTQDNFERPVAAVSDQYDLLQHQVLATWLQTIVSDAGLKDLDAQVTITQYGERLRVIIPLEERKIDIRNDLLDPDYYRPELEIRNSVDRSTAFTVLLRWRRLICLNGMFTVQEDRLRSVHHVVLSRNQMLREFIADRLVKTPDVVSELKTWKKKKVDRAKVQEWCEGWLREKSGWTIENCARLWAILETGFDGTVRKPSDRFERHPLKAYRVGQERKVPGVSFPIQTAYDVAQLLTWITSHQRTVEFQTDGTEDVPRLMRMLLKS